ncbi:MAG: hypothetical protein FWD34_02850 [Oscillospiraceae bacterium]|nr:hypothetical protein [Oscillospiraceae bacterium]
MNPVVVTTTMNIKGREFLLADVTRGMGQIGVFRFGSDPSAITDIFYVENEPIISIGWQNLHDPYANKFLTQISSTERCSEYIRTRLSVVGENYFIDKQGLSRSIMPVLELLPDGLYVVHESRMIQSDGEGRFFWNSYNNRREVFGSADRNAAIGDGNYSPCFLVPTDQVASYQPNKMNIKSDKLNMGVQLGGVAYHIAGMFSVLLEGHHTATACLLNDKDFRCLVIEPISDVIYDSHNEDDDGIKPKIIALACPFIKIPLDMLPDNSLERFLVSRRYIKPYAYAEIKSKMTKNIRSVSKRSFPVAAYEKALQLPDLQTVESASGVNSVSEEQLAALLKGEVQYEDEFIVSSNHYSSVVTVCNFLKISNFERFLSFSLEILKSEELSASHKFVAEQMLTIIHQDICEYFSSVAESKEEKDGFVPAIAHKYMKRWNEFQQRKEEEETAANAAHQKHMDAMTAMAESKGGVAHLEAAVRQMGGLTKGM